MNNPRTVNHSLKAVIREEECIGCTKCIQACPTDAILGAMKLMHTVITDACTGCGLCVPPCPLDCIDMMTVPEPPLLEKENNESRWALRRQERVHRLQRASHPRTMTFPESRQLSVSERKAAIMQAVQRVREKNESR